MGLLGGLVLFLYGMEKMSEGLKKSAGNGMRNILSALTTNRILGLSVGAFVTMVIQSSSAFTGIVIVLASQGLLSLEAGIPMLLGANIGTCITAGLASLGASREAKRVALAHVIFNTAGAIIFLFWIPYFAELVRWISPVSDSVGIQTACPSRNNLLRAKAKKSYEDCEEGR